MTIFLIAFVIAITFSIVKSGNKILFNDIFWMFVFWGLIIGVYFFSGVTWKYNVSVGLILFLTISFISFMAGRSYGTKKRVKLFSKETSIVNQKLFCFIGLLGVVLFSVDYIRLNGFFSIKSEYKISIIGSIGNFMIPILLVLGLYMFASTLIVTGKINIKALLLLAAYSVPCILNSGRESLAFVVVGIAAIYGYYAKHNQVSYRYVNIKKMLRKIMIIAIVIGVLFFVVHISKERFGDNEVSTFLNTHNVSAIAKGEAERWGDFEFLYYNIASYFSHQISFLEFMFKEYKGPYMFGMYELNIISRRLPDFLGLDYMSVSRQLRNLYGQVGVSYSGDWFTVLGSFIVDFGRVGSILACFICGYFTGKVKKKIRLCDDVRYAVLRAIICVCMFSSIQLGPFYNTLVYGAFLWWLIIFRRDET